MASTVLVPLAEYLSKTYHPGCDYVEGILEERNAGEISHSEAQSALLVYIRTQIAGFWAGVEVRVQVKAGRLRVPDVVMVRARSRLAASLRRRRTWLWEFCPRKTVPPAFRNGLTITLPSGSLASG
jgi:hypothetical protein